MQDEPVYKDAGMLEVSFRYKGSPAKSIVLLPAFQTIEIETILNIEGVKWNVVSDKPWCIVDDDVIHEGSDTFEITVVANEGYVDREPAVVSLCAGEYKTDLRVGQNGNVFIMDQVFCLGMQKAGNAEVVLKVEEGTQWEARPDCEWVTVTSEEVSTSDGETEYRMIVSWDENLSASRLGTVGLYRTGDEIPVVKYALWQFGAGQEYDFEAEDNIRVASKPSAETPLEIRTPYQHIESLNCPEWVQLEKVENGDNTTSWLLYFDPNPSDYNGYRETRLTYTTLNSSEATTLPTIYQDSYPVGGLMTAKGFALFADKFNSGGAEAVVDWVKDGVVNVLSMVDLSELNGAWKPIGTDEYPFNLKFNGNDKTISGFSVSGPLFGVCNGAEIYDVILDKSCEVTVKDNFNTDLYLSALVGKLLNSTVNDCSSSAKITVEKQSVNNNEKVYAGGLVAYVGQNAVVSGSRFDGQMNIAVKRGASNGDVYIGGLAGYTEGTIEDCENVGKVSDNSMSKYHYLGGITGYATTAAEISKCRNISSIMHTSTRDMGNVTGMTSTVCVGGLVGKNYGVLKESGYLGSAEVLSDASNIYIGGVSGSVDAVPENVRPLEKCYCEEGCSILYTGPDMKNSPSSLGKYVRIGGLVGMLYVPLELDQIVVNCDINSAGMQNGGSLFVGGIVGYTTKELELMSSQWGGDIIFDMPNVDIKSASSEVCIGGVLGKTSASGMSLTKAGTSGTIHVNAVKKVWEAPMAIGGVVGCAADGCEVSETINGADLTWTGTHSSTANGGKVSTGGIVGRIDKGVANLYKCTNNARVHNVSDAGSNWEIGNILGARTGGIIGTYGFVKDGDGNFDASVFDSSDSNKITIEDCHTTSEVLGHRGLVGGIAGYLYNAEVSLCSYTGTTSSTRINNNLGGIAGAVEKTIIKDCVARASLYGSAYKTHYCRVGGIVSRLYTGSNLSNCRYFGHITGKKEGDHYYGGIVGEAHADCSVKGCSFGGSILSEPVTADNYEDYIVGNKAIETTDCTYWTGE